MANGVRNGKGLKGKGQIQGRISQNEDFDTFGAEMMERKEIVQDQEGKKIDDFDDEAVVDDEAKNTRIKRPISSNIRAIKRNTGQVSGIPGGNNLKNRAKRATGSYGNFSGTSTLPSSDLQNALAKKGTDYKSENAVKANAGRTFPQPKIKDRMRDNQSALS